MARVSDSGRCRHIGTSGRSAVRVDSGLDLSNDAGLAGAAGRTPLEAAASVVAMSCGATLRVSDGPRDDAVADGTAASMERIEALARRSGIRTRPITLAPDWWRRDGPSFVGFTDDDERPLGIVANGRGGYRALDPEAGADFAVNRRTAAGIAPDGVALYAPLPDELGAGPRGNPRSAARSSPWPWPRSMD